MDAPSSQAAGLEAAFRELRPDLERRARAMGAVNEAEDILQEVWIRLRAARAPVGNPRAYLYHMVYTAVLDHKRGRRRSSARDGDWVQTDYGGLPSTTQAPEAERALIARETLAQVHARLEALGDPAAAIFRRHRIDGETQRHIAEDLRMGLSTVEKHLRRAYAAILGLDGDEA
ncbi:RNA polymerase sigma factor [Brevundimonas sp.]|jgi:RNA polymerase sigma factor (sigma-70 family)|uniref:RNA polymerase sigma factor n=1 Tax=Brevundimonas sp. TaxID=1871086 RepID=UPI0037BFAD38